MRCHAFLQNGTLETVALPGLGAFCRPELREAALAHVKEGPVRPNELLSVSQAMSADIAGRDLVFSWFMENYGFIMERVPPCLHRSLPL